MLRVVLQCALVLTLKLEYHRHFIFLMHHPIMPGWFKGMEKIIQEHGLWPESGLPAECSGFKCPTNQTSCCCCCLLFNQPDFSSQKSRVQELVEACHHICDFYPKYHCELNFIEQYRGAAKFQFRQGDRAANMGQLLQKVKRCLDEVPLTQNCQ